MIKLFKTQYLKFFSNQDNTKNIWQDDEDIINTPVDFNSLLFAYNNSSIISGIIEKISRKTDVGFEETKNKILDNFLNNLDIYYLVKNLLVFGIGAFERLKTTQNIPTLELEPFLISEIRLAKEDKEYFLYQKKQDKKIGFTKQEVLFFKTNSLSNKYYGDSIFDKAMDELILLAFITKYYKNFFGNGNIEPNILYDETGELTEEQLEKIENMINDRVAGIDNSHNTVFVGGKIGKIDLSTKIDPDKFINLKRELKEDIAIATNIPFDLLSSQDSNRATSTTALKSLYNDIIKPLQKTITSQLKKQLKDFLEAGVLENISLEDIENIRFSNINLNDPKEEMETLTGYQKNGVLSANEVRIKANLGEPIDGLDEYKVINSKEDKEDKKNEEDLQKVEEKIKKIYEVKNKKGLFKKFLK